MTTIAASLPEPDQAQSPAPTPRVRHLLDVARAAFVAQGFASVSIDGLARDAGVSKETIYRHFADKEALFRAALEELGSEFSSRAAALHRASAPPGEELAGLARAVLDSADEGGLLSPLRLAAGVAGVMPDFARDLQAFQWQQLEPVRRVLEDYAQTRGITAPVPLDLALDFGSLAVAGPALLLGFPQPDASDRAVLATRTAALFAEGVLGAADLKGAIQPEPEAELSATALQPAPHIRALLDVAARHFLEQGYEGVSLLDIGAEARVGRGTLYRHFGSKAGLFSAVLRDLAAQLAAMAQPPVPIGPALIGSDYLQEQLAAFAASAMTTLGSPLSLALHRAAMGAALRDPALAREVHDTVREPWIAPLALWLGQEVGVAAPRWLANALLVIALQGNRLFSTGRSLPSSETPARAERVAKLFLHGFAATLTN